MATSVTTSPLAGTEAGGRQVADTAATVGTAGASGVEVAMEVGAESPRVVVVVVAAVPGAAVGGVVGGVMARVVAFVGLVTGCVDGLEVVVMDDWATSDALNRWAPWTSSPSRVRRSGG